MLLCEHEDVYTAGRAHRDVGPARRRHPRGRRRPRRPHHLARARASSSATPSCRLATPIDVVRYVRVLEEALIRTCADLGLDADPRRGPQRGVVRRRRRPRRERKVAAIGVRVSRGVTMHGFALNCEPDLTAFDRIVPCGIADADVTSLSVETGRRVTIAEVLPLVRGHLVDTLVPILDARAPSSAV